MNIKNNYLENIEEVSKIVNEILNAPNKRDKTVLQNKNEI